MYLILIFLTFIALEIDVVNVSQLHTVNNISVANSDWKNLTFTKTKNYKDLKKYNLYQRLRRKHDNGTDKSNFNKWNQKILFSKAYDGDRSTFNNALRIRRTMKNVLTFSGRSKKQKQTKFQEVEVPWNPHVLPKNLVMEATPDPGEDLVSEVASISSPILLRFSTEIEHITKMAKLQKLSDESIVSGPNRHQQDLQRTLDQTQNPGTVSATQSLQIATTNNGQFAPLPTNLISNSDANFRRKPSPKRKLLAPSEEFQETGILGSEDWFIDNPNSLKTSPRPIRAGASIPWRNRTLNAKMKSLRAYFSPRSRPWREEEWSRGPTGPDSIYYNYYNDYLRSEQIGKWNTYVSSLPPYHQQVLDQEVPSYTSKGHWINVPVRKQFYDDNFLEYLKDRVSRFSTWSAFVKANPGFTRPGQFYGTTKILAVFASKPPKPKAEEYNRKGTELALYRKDYIVLTESQPVTPKVMNVGITSTVSRHVGRSRFTQSSDASEDEDEALRKRYPVEYKKYSGILSAYCYVCGVWWPHFFLRSNQTCWSVFEAPPNPLAKLRNKYRWKCTKTTTRKHQRPAEFWLNVHHTAGNVYTGGCYKRWVDVGYIYNERGCRTWPVRLGYSYWGYPDPQVKGSYASDRLYNLEKTLRYETDACVSSPHASLTPFSRSINLFARYHVCVCSKRWCNAAHTHLPGATALAALLMTLLKCFIADHTN